MHVLEYLVDETCGDYPPLYKNWIAYDGRPISLFVSATIFAKTVLQDQSELPIEKEKYDIHWVSGLPSSTSSPPTNDSVAESSVTFTKTTSDSRMSTNIGSEVFESTTEQQATTSEPPLSTAAIPTNQDTLPKPETTADTPMSTFPGTEVFESTQSSKPQLVSSRFRQQVHKQIRNLTRT